MALCWAVQSPPAVLFARKKVKKFFSFTSLASLHWCKSWLWKDSSLQGDWVFISWVLFLGEVNSEASALAWRGSPVVFPADLEHIRMHTSNSGSLVMGSFQVHLKMFPSYGCILQHINQHNPLILHYITIVLGVGERWGVLPGTSRSFLLTGQLQKYLLLAGLGIFTDKKIFWYLAGHCCLLQWNLSVKDPEISWTTYNWSR